mmetsp:Transcript_13590/g.16239  ORF Transcript_13590/g.16239 Transcript_13590/m.16239 type:complete len:85 (-) Transcript_13590:375-629(-)
MKVSLRKYAIFPDMDKLLTLQKLSTNTILHCTNPKNFQNQAAKTTGMHVPGPLTRIKSGARVGIFAIQATSALMVISTVRPHDM